MGNEIRIDKNTSFLPEEFQKFKEVTQLKLMRRWFNYNFGLSSSEDKTDYISVNGSHNAKTELINQFGKLVNKDLICKLNSELKTVALKWGKKTYWKELIGFKYGFMFLSKSFKEFNATIDNIHDLLHISIDKILKKILCKAMYAYVITALETYLTETMREIVINNPIYLTEYRELVDNCSDSPR